MIYITQLIYLQPGKEEIFNEFEAMAIPIINQYEGVLMLRIKSGEVIEAAIEAPYEIHLVSFPSEAHFEQFKRDETRKSFLHLKEQSVKSVLMIQGS